MSLGADTATAKAWWRGGVRSWGSLAAGCLVYAPLAAAITVMTRWQLSVDGVAYLRIAKYCAEGRIDLAVTGYWAPLLSWLIVPVYWLGGDVLLAGHVVNAAAGLFLIAGVWRLTRLFQVAGPIAQVMPTAAGLLALTWLGWGVLADPMLAALVTWYFAENYLMCRTFRARHAAIPGAVAGAAYLAKYYALPFFILHHFLSVFLLGRRPGRWLPGRRQLVCYLVGMLTFTAVGLPWVAILSFRYGRPTFATTGRVVHALAGPNVPEGRCNPPCRMADPRPGRVTVWENPDEIKYGWPRWSPIGSPREMIHQLRLFYRNGRAVAMLLFEADSFGLLYLCFLTIPVMAILPLSGVGGTTRSIWRWATLAVACYLSGLLLVFAGSRRYYWPLEGLLLALVGLAGTCILRRLLPNRGRRGHRYRARIIVEVVILVAFLVPNVHTARNAGSRPGADLVRLAEELRCRGVSGPLVANHWPKGVVVAYHMDTPCAGALTAKTVAELREQLGKVSAKTLLVFGGAHSPPAAASVDRLVARIADPYVTLRKGEHEIRVYSTGGILATIGQSNKGLSSPGHAGRARYRSRIVDAACNDVPGSAPGQVRSSGRADRSCREPVGDACDRRTGEPLPS